MKTVFLFLNGLHQLFHTAMTAMELGKMRSGVVCLSCNDQHTMMLERIRNRCGGTTTEIIQAKAPFRYRYLNFKGKTYPSVNAIVRRSAKLLKEADAVVTTSHGTPGIFRRFRITRPRIIFQYHGCGDWRYTFDKAFRHMDLMLVAGEYHRQRLLDENIADQEKIRIVGYPKFDIPANSVDRPFPNNLPTVLYCPHWRPELTSYNEFTDRMLGYFSNSDRFNLILAPHMLIKHWRTHHRYKLHSQPDGCNNIKIDYGSIQGADGTYLRQADIYVGDVSSMVYEFIAMKPRPCIFLNAHGADWKNNPDYRFWEYGPVVDSMEGLTEALLSGEAKAEAYMNLQKQRVPEYIDLTETPSSQRAAIAINEFLG